MGDFSRFISISRTVTANFHDTRGNDWPQIFNEYKTFWERSGRQLDPNLEIWIQIPDHFWLRLWPWPGLLAILAKRIAIAIAILGGNSIAIPVTILKSITILSAILYFKSVLQYYCNTFFNTPSRACAHIQHGTGSHCQLYYYKWKPRCTHIIVPALTQH